MNDRLFIYVMRIRDDKKQEALLLATIKLVNEIGFAASSVAKIAREAGVSPATLYIYFKNKEDLLVSTYLEIKQGMGKAMLEGFDEAAPLYETLHQVWKNTFTYVVQNPEEFRYVEQFSNSPYSDKVDPQKVQEQFEPLLLAIRHGIEQKIIKNVSLDVLGAFLIHPIMVLANPRHCKTFHATEENVAAAFSMAWDAIKR